MPVQVIIAKSILSVGLFWVLMFAPAVYSQPSKPVGSVEWEKLLGREGQEIVSKALGQATRRLDVDTRWRRESGVIPAKDHMSVNDFWQIENQSEEKIDKVREPALKIAQALLN